MHNFVNDFIHFQKECTERDLLRVQYSKKFELYLKEYPMYCFLVFLIVNIMSFYIKNKLSSFINRIKNTDFNYMYCILLLLSISIFSDVILLSIRISYDIILYLT